MALVREQTKTGTGTGNSINLSINPTKKNSVIVVVFNISSATASSPTVTDNAGNTYTQLYFGGSVYKAGFFYCQKSKAGATTITISATNGSNTRIVMREYSGVSLAGVDKYTQAEGAFVSSQSSGNTATTSYGNELVIAWFGGSTSSASISAPYGNVQNSLSGGNSAGLADKTVGWPATTQSATYSGLSGGSYVTVGVVTFKLLENQRYLVATGDWSGDIWADESSGSAGSAPPPTAEDSVEIATNNTVTLDEDAECGILYHSNGTLDLNGYTLDPGMRFMSYGNTPRTLILNGRIEHTYEGFITWQDFQLSGTNLTVNSANSVIELSWKTDEIEYGNYIRLGNHTLNDLIVNLGVGSTQSIPLNITGSPTFRSLIIQSKNSAAHTVNFEQSIVANKFVALGSSPTNRLALECASTPINIDSEWDGTKYIGTCYGQNLAIGEVDFSYGEVGWGYVGTNSISTDANTGWTFQDPPKISTLVDPLTTAPGSNTNWTVSGTVTQESGGIEGGGYKLASGATMVSTDTFDLLASELVVETSDDGLMIKVVETDALDIYISGQWVFVSTRDSSYVIEEGPDGATKFVKLAVSSGGVLSVKYSNDGTSWVDGQLGETYSLAENEVVLIRSVRLKVTGSTSVLGSINVLPTPKNTGNFFAFFT